jgi:ribosome-associated protein
MVMSSRPSLPPERIIQIPLTLEAAQAAAVRQGEGLCNAIAFSASELKAGNMMAFDVREIVSFTDFFLLITANSQTHIRALSERIERDLKPAGIRPERIDGARGSSWLVLDYGDVIVHIMTEESRKTFDLERLWGDAPRLLLGS